MDGAWQQTTQNPMALQRWQFRWLERLDGVMTWMADTGACVRNHPKAKISEIELEIGKTLKHAPNKAGRKNKTPTASEATVEINSEDEDNED
ncbi:hypothetical protein EOD39_10606 [Acipenser ruthenus]|uniref:Uncharacterized protein n=1 Tax=Acipenser ruthenus TaxID=7906 RepID=A0A444TXA1_ACIRT|nr:hypothetical protein EOD39_10606 [Acipenser ruthenus]